MLLQLRSRLTQEPGTWSIPGGAIARGESVEQCAFREAAEECGIPFDVIAPTATHRSEHGDWSYTTVLADLQGRFVMKSNAEAVTHRWVVLEDVVQLPLHEGFKASWPQLRAMLP